MAKGQGDRVAVGGHTLRLTNLDKVLYPATGTTKRDVLAYYAAVAEWLLPHTEDRPATRKRWVDGTAGPAFFEKNLPDSAPSWVARRTLEHSDHANVYPLVNDAATLAWLAQVAALEIHVPQWRFGPRGARRNPDRLVLDLDPGEGVGLPECVAVAQDLHRIVDGMGLALHPVTSGSKGLHLYAALDGTQTAAQVSDVAHELARAMEADHPDLVLSTMGKQDRRGRVLLDWSQNNGNKTTVAPYSLRGRERPTVAMPRTWRELASKTLRQMEYRDVLKALNRRGDPMLGVSSGTPVPPGALDREKKRNTVHPAPDTTAAAADERHDQADDPPDRLTRYRSMRDPAKTTEPVPADAPATSDGRTFVIQEHHARRLHWDFRLEHDGVLVSWALPKGEPQSPRENHLAVQTEDHPLEYGSFEGTIAAGEYGAGTVTIWDSGTYDLEKWRDDEEVIVVLHGEQRGSRRVALIRTGRGGGSQKASWLIHRMKDDDDERGGTSGPSHAGRGGSQSQDPAPTPPAARRSRSHSASSPRAPMLASPGTAADIGDPDEWAYELKWDGIRALVAVHDGAVTLTSRNGHDLTASYPEFARLAERLGTVPAGAGHGDIVLGDTMLDGDTVLGDTVLDGEIVAVDSRGRPDFGLLQTRMNLTRARDVERARDRAPVRLLLFDALEIDGRSLVRDTYDERRAALEASVALTGDKSVDVPPAFEGSLDEALAFASKLRLEGVVAKRRDSTYSVGRRSRAWVKLKHHATQEVVIAGWRPGAGRRKNGVGSLLMGIPSDGGLRYVGRVGTGFRDRDLDEILPLLEREARKTSPLMDVPKTDGRDAHWVTPRRVGEVEFAEWTSTGRLRQPSWRGWRPDKDPGDVVRES